MEIPEPTKIICLGKEFNSEEERREYFRNELRAKLPELKKIEGFPIGEDEDIINLSDPPYYTACPNPWLNDFIAEWEQEKESIPGRQKDFHVDEPYASDVSEGKYDPMYLYHPYLTKVPHKAILKFILHYTQPGDVVFDGFAGTGMTGVAARCCGSLDFQSRFKIEEEFKNLSIKQPEWGTRKSICSDLSPLASFIAFNYNSKIDLENFDLTAKRILKLLKDKCLWMYETSHSNGGKGIINYTLWSDVFICPSCNSEIIFWENAVNKEEGKVLDSFNCPHCNYETNKKELSPAVITYYDEILGKSTSEDKSVPVLINYSYGGKRFQKKPDKSDLINYEKVQSFKSENWLPIIRMPEGDESRRNDKKGITHVHQFYSKRNLITLSTLKSLIDEPIYNVLITKVAFQTTKLYRFTYQSGVWGAGGGPLSGTLYIPSLIKEINILNQFEDAVNGRKKIAPPKLNSDVINSLQSATSLQNIKSDSVDYIFTDPPFGSNLMYSELNFLAESWLKILTNNKSEAIENKSQNKTVLEYQDLMTNCFKEYYRILKPSKWMTVEFSNTSAAIWNSIQTALQRAGFIIANVAGLDKQKTSFKAVTSPTAVKQDLVISCYKPTLSFENNFKSQQGEVATWDFVREHLNHLPAHIKKDNSTTAIVERSPKILFDRLITFYLMRGLPVPIDAKDFQEGLKQRFVERDGMYFTGEQAAEYDEKKAKAPQFVQLSLIVTNESDAIEWLKDRLRKQAQKYQDIMPDFRIATQSLRKGDTLPELQDILNENFIQESDGRWRTPDPNEAKDREALRTKVLLKEFNGYVTAISQPRAKKLKEVRVEALRAGFKNCWEQKDFKTIVTLGDMIPQNILLEDEQLLMYYDIAKDRV
ncbi:MAG: DNA methylase [Sphingobacteriales bacterium]|nr:DNA methylase [Sphingobacteriales bacterium]